MSIRLTDAKKAEITAIYAETGSVRRAAALAGVSFSGAKAAILLAGFKAQEPIVEPTTMEREEAGDNLKLKFSTRTRIRTLEDAIAHANVDLTQWRVKKWKVTCGEVAMKVVSREVGKITAETPVVEPVTWVSMELERLLPKVLQDALKEVFVELRRESPIFREPRPRKAELHLCVIDLVDIHFGKLAWAAETGQNYDLKIADRAYRNAILDLLDRAKGYEIGEFLVPIGSDAMHIDNGNGTTTAGTPQDVDGRLAKILKTALAAYVWAVERLASIAMVRFVWVPGNHDWQLSLCLAMMLDARFYNAPHVTIDYEPTARKYHRFGKVLIGMVHGNEEKHSSLPIIMATERPDFGECTVKEWHVGHWHKSRQTETLSLETHGGVPVRVLRSLSAVDAWHYKRGFVGSTRSAEAFLYSETEWVAHFVANARGEEKGAA